jgi:hypothetical protein
MTEGLPNGSRAPLVNGETCGRSVVSRRETGHNECGKEFVIGDS